MEGLPLGTRGGLAIQHYFPLDGEYVIKVRLWRATADVIKGLEELHQVEISVDGNRVKLATIGGKDEAELSYINSGKSAGRNRRPPHGSCSGEGRAAHRGGYVPGGRRGAGRQHSAAVRTRQSRSVGFSRPAGCGSREYHWTAALHRSQRDTQPQVDFRLPAHRPCGRSAVRQEDYRRARAAGLSPAGVGKRSRDAAELLPERAQRRRNF